MNMNAPLLKLVSRNFLTNSEYIDHAKIFRIIAEEYASKMADIENPDDNPDILNVRSSPKSSLLTSLAEYSANLAYLIKIIDLPRKFIETDEMRKVNQLRLLDFGLMKRTVIIYFKNDPANPDAQKLWHLIRVLKRLNRLKSPSIHTHLCKLVEELEGETYKSSCTALKLTDLVTKLKEKNQKYETLFLQRSILINENYKSVKPYRKICDEGYISLFNTIDILIKLDPNTDYSEFITKMNGNTYYFNNLIQNKKTRAKSKKEKEEAPGNPEDPDIL